MAGFSGSYRAQMEAASRAAQEEAAAAGEMSWSEISDMLNYADQLDKPASSGEMSWAEFNSFLEDGPAASEMAGGGGGLSALPEAAADAAAYDLAGSAMLGGLGAAGLQWFIGQLSYSDPSVVAPATYNWGPEWTLQFSGAPKTFATVLGKPGPLPYFKMGVNPAPTGRNSVSAPSVIYGDGSISSNSNLGEDVIGPLVTGVWCGTYRVPWGPGVTNVPPGNDSQLSYDKRTRTTTGARVTVRHASFPCQFRGLSAPPASVSEPLTSAGDGADRDHPSNRRNYWRLGPQDWPNIPRHHQSPKPPDQPPPGGTSGGGGSSGGWNPEPPPDPSVWWPSLEDGPAPYKVPAHSYSPTSDNSWDKENDWHMLAPDYAIKILMEAGIYRKTHWFKSPKGLDDLFKILAKSIPNHPCVGLTGTARVQCVMDNLGSVSWKHFAGQVGREASKVEEPGVVRTPLPNWDRRAKKAFHVVRAVHNSVALGVKRSRVFSSRKGMF